MFGRKKIAALAGEFLGVSALTLVFLTVSRSSIGLPYFVALAVGIVTTLLVFAFSTTQTGAHLNPAITIGLWTIRKIKTLDAVLYIAVQLIGAYLAYVLFTYFVSATLPTSVQEFSGRVLVAEAIGTFALAFGWAAAYYRGYKNLAFGAVVGLSYTLGILIASSASLGLLNPAVALGNRDWEWATYVLGPVLGSLIGFNLYSLLFVSPEKLVPAAETAITSRESVASAVVSRVRKSATKAKTTPSKKSKTTK